MKYESEAKEDGAWSYVEQGHVNIYQGFITIPTLPEWSSVTQCMYPLDTIMLLTYLLRSLEIIDTYAT